MIDDYYMVFGPDLHDIRGECNSEFPAKNTLKLILMGTHLHSHWIQCGCMFFIYEKKASSYRSSFTLLSSKLYYCSYIYCSNFVLSFAGMISSGNDICQFFASILISYYAGKGHRPRWLAVSSLMLALFCITNSLPYFIFGPGDDAKSVTKEYGSISSFNFSLDKGNVCKFRCTFDKITPRFNSIHLIFSPYGYLTTKNYKIIDEKSSKHHDQKK